MKKDKIQNLLLTLKSRILLEFNGSQRLVPESIKQAWADLQFYVENGFEFGKHIEHTRTLKQNRALHKFCSEVAHECIQKGITYKVLIESLEVEPTSENIKDIFRAVGKAMFNVDKTSKMSVDQLSQVTEKVNILLAKQGIETEFPSEEKVRLEMELAQNSMYKN